MRLFYAPGACSLSAHILLREAGLPFQLEKVDLQAGEQHSEAFRRLNPAGLVPVLAAGDVVLTELPAISWYIAQQAPARKLYPADVLGQARVMEWLNWLSGTVHGWGFGGLWRPMRFVHEPALHPAVQARGRDWIEQGFARINQRLEAGFAVGDALTVVDPYLLVMYRWGGRIGLPMRSRFPHWHRHAGEMLARDSVQAALAAEGISVDLEA